MVQILTTNNSKMSPKLIWRNGLLLVSNRKSILLEVFVSQRKVQVTVRRRVNSKLFALVTSTVQKTISWHNLQCTTTIPCIHCYQSRFYDQYQFSISECEQAIKEGASVAYCRGVLPIRLDRLAPDLAMVGLSNKKIEYSSFEIGRMLGEGSFAKVFQAKLGSEELAVKQFHEEAQDFNEFQREVWTMSGLHHANIVRLIGFCTSPLCIVSEFMPEGNLYSYIHSESQPVLGPRLYLRIAMDIAKALRFLHWKLSPPMIHNDLKTPNVLLASTNDTDGVVAKLTDFGLSSQAFQEKRLNQEKGNPRW